MDLPKTCAGDAGHCVPSIGPATLDEGARRIRRWLAVRARIEDLQRRGDELERQRARDRHDLDHVESLLSPLACELRHIEGALDQLMLERDALLVPFEPDLLDR